MKETRTILTIKIKNISKIGFRYIDLVLANRTSEILVGWRSVAGSVPQFPLGPVEKTLHLVAA
jgi:hypothetical protein